MFRGEMRLGHFLTLNALVFDPEVYKICQDIENITEMTVSYGLNCRNLQAKYSP